MLNALFTPILIVALTTPTAHAQDAPALEWEVVNRFRLFGAADISDDPVLQQALADYDSGTASDSRALYTALLTRLSGPAAEPLREAQVDSCSRPAVRGYADDYLYPEHYTIRVHTDALPEGTRCRWRAGDGTEQAARCSEPIELNLPPRADASGAEGVVALSVDGQEWSYPVSFDDRLVVAMGDSYMSGEGNPDVPSVLFPPVDLAVGRSAKWVTRLSEGEYSAASWWDEPCHRSLLSWPVLAGVLRAAEQEHEAVTLVHLACSGATVDAGILGRQKKVFGWRNGEVRRRGQNEPVSQIEQLDALLRYSMGRRHVDDVYVSIGGNDIGFAGVVTSFLLPPNGWRAGDWWAPQLVAGRAGAICAYDREHMDKYMRRLCGRRASAAQRLTLLPERFERLHSELSTRPDLRRVHLMAIPNPGIGDGGNFCATGFAGREGRSAGFEAAISLIPSFLRTDREWRFQITGGPEEQAAEGRPAESEAVCEGEPSAQHSEACQGHWVWANLRDGQRDVSERFGWTFVDGHLQSVRTHGWCNDDSEARLAFPRSVGAKGHQDWESGNQPGQFDGYRYDLPRWFRTTNDSVLMQYQGPQFSSSNISGTIHPTFRAHLEMALAARQP